jgi:preprotein translocase subunit SecF
MRELDFIRWRKVSTLISISLLTLGMLSLILKGGLNYGVDFAGGNLIQIKFAGKLGVKDLEKMRSLLKEDGIGCSIQQFGGDREVIIRVESKEEEVGERVRDVIESGGFTLSDWSSTYVGPSISRDLKKIAILAIIFAFTGIVLYITWRFEFRFAIAAIVALLHDVLIVVGVFSLTGKEFNIPIIAAILAIIGYSLNDTIVVFDRIRENLRLLRKELYSRILNHSINQSLKRTLITSLTTLFAVTSLYIWGGIVIHDFSFALIIGVIVGTYSSIFIASPLLLLLQKKKLFGKLHGT